LIACDVNRRRGRPSRAAAALIIALVSGGWRSAAAQTSEGTDVRAQAQAHLSRGNDLFTGDRFQEALAEFQAAFAAFPSPKLRFNIGQCQRALGHRTEALAEFRRFLDEAEDVAPDLRAEATRYVAELSATENPGPIPGTAMPTKAAAPAPQLALALAAPEPPMPPSAPAVPAEPDARRPIYKRWWFWVALGAVAAGAVTGAVLWERSREPSCSVNCFP